MNGARGEAGVEIGGEARRLCLTLGALAELETAFGVEGFEALGGRLQDMGAADLDVALRALLRGGGEAALADSSAPLAVGPVAAARAVAAAFKAAFA